MIDFKGCCKSNFNFIFAFGVIFCTSIIVRLPHFLSQDFFFDGDEGVVGIMAQDFLYGKGLPIYFYGQNYGFSSFEVLSTSLFIKIIGSGVWALRLGGLLLFSIGLTFVWKSFRETNVSMAISILSLLFFVLSPTWFLWGSLVRGGYVTAFMCFGILFYVTQLKKLNWKWIFFSSIFSVIANESQPLIFIPVLPFLINWMLPVKSNFKKILGFGATFLIVGSLIHYFGANETIWSPPKSTFFDLQQFENLKVQFEGMIYSYSNFFYFTMDIPIPGWWFVLLLISLGLITTYIIIFYFKSEKEKKRVIQLMVLCLLLSVFLISTVSMYSPRYWLGFFTGLLFLLIYSVIESKHSKFKDVIVISLTIIFCLGIIVSKDMKRDWYQVEVNEMDAISELYMEVKHRKIEAVFIADPVLQWKWNYLFGREIPGTFFSKNERTNEFKDLVSKKYKSRPNKTAIIGFHKFYNELDKFESFSANCDQVAVKYYIMDSVEKQFVDLSIEMAN